MIEKRKHVRTEFNGEVSITHPTLGTQVLTMRDISNGGVYLLTHDKLDLPIGDSVTVQSTDMADAPLVEARVVRIDADGVALIFSE